MFGKNLAYVIQSLSSMIIAYLLASLLFGYTLKVAQPGLFVVSVIFTTASFVCFGLLLAPMFVANPDIRQFVNALEYPMYILGGFLFPIALLPGWTTPLSYLLAPYWAAQALHAASAGTATLSVLAVDWGCMLLLGALYLLISRWLFRVFLRKARQDATLEFFLIEATPPCRGKHERESPTASPRGGQRPHLLPGCIPVVCRPVHLVQPDELPGI